MEGIRNDAILLNLCVVIVGIVRELKMENLQNPIFVVSKSTNNEYETNSVPYSKTVWNRETPFFY